VMTAGQGLNLRQRVYDEHGVYPLNFHSLNQLPTGWWYRRAVVKHG